MQAETYYNRAALLAPSTQDKEALLSFKLCQARISDYSRKFLEAASRYHELSWVTEIDEDDRAHMLWVLQSTTYLLTLTIIPQIRSSNMRSARPRRAQPLAHARIALP